MTKSFLIIFALLASFTILPTSAKGEDIDSKIDRFARADKETKSADQKQALCIGAMDDGLFKKYDSIKVVDRMFHTNYANYFIDKNEDVGCAFIYFKPQHAGGYYQAPNVGWYLAVKYDRDHLIRDFYLSNQNEM